MSNDSGLRVQEVRISNFRGLKNVRVRLSHQTLLIGENNAGKTSFLEALNIAIGQGRRPSPNEDDIFLDVNGDVDKDRVATIDILLRPLESDGNPAKAFPGNSFWISHFGSNIAIDPTDESELVGIRTRIQWSAEKGSFETQRNFLKEWTFEADPDSWLADQSGPLAPMAAIAPVALYYMDAKRDLDGELRARESFWGKIVADPGFPEASKDKWEAVLNELSQEMLASSKVLGHLQSHLEALGSSVASESGSIALTPMPRRLRDLKNGVNLDLATPGSPPFPVGRHGMGTRSLASVLVFRAYATWRQTTGDVDTIHQFLALEEPEAHLHPQAQRALYRQIHDFPGQCIVSTHSPYIASQARIADFRHFAKVGGETRVNVVDVSQLTEEEIRSVERFVMYTRGEIFFSRLVVLVEGETEEHAFPIYALKEWGINPNALGVTFIAVGGTNYKPFLRVCIDLQIPWMVFSDGDVREDLKKTLRNLKLSEVDPRVHYVPTGCKDYEHYLCLDDTYKSEIIEVLSRDGQEASDPRAITARKKRWNELPNWKAEAVKTMQAAKAALAPRIAAEIVKKNKVPGTISAMFRAIAAIKGILPAAEMPAAKGQKP